LNECIDPHEGEGECAAKPVDFNRLCILSSIEGDPNLQEKEPGEDPRWLPSIELMLSMEDPSMWIPLPA
jgi:hypothetical protein